MQEINPLHLRIFLSSPDDVDEERLIARQVLNELPKKPHVRGKVTVEIIDWKDPDAPSPMDAGKTPQESVNRFKGRPAECDLTVAILWGRIGTPLPPHIVRADGSRYESGTVWEYEDARQADKHVWLYRRKEEPRIRIKDPEYQSKYEQYEAVEQFFERFKNLHDGSSKGGFTEYSAHQEFRDKFEKHLETFIRNRLETRLSGSSGVGLMWSWPKPWDFSGYIDEKRRSFIGREWLFEKVESWLKSAEGQALLIVADYGVGKSAFLAELVCRNTSANVAAHHFCHHDTAETLNPATFVRSVAAQLAQKYPDYKSDVETDSAALELLDTADRDPGSAFERAIIGPLGRMSRPSADACIILDALDESLEFKPGEVRKGVSHIVGLLASHATRLPSWLKILATSRRRQEVLQRIQQSFHTQTIDAEDADNLEDGSTQIRVGK